MPRAKFTRTEIIRAFWSRVKKLRGRDGCWLWTGGVNHKGYGKFYANGNPNIRAHKFAFKLANRKLPRGKLLCHRCDVRRCVRPTHMFVGTIADNQKDMARKGRARFGERHPQAHISASTVSKVRCLYRGGMRQVNISRKLRLPSSTVSRIVNRRTRTRG